MAEPLYKRLQKLRSRLEALKLKPAASSEGAETTASAQAGEEGERGE